MSQQQSTCPIRGDGGRTVRRILERVGNKWTLVVIATLHGQRLRFTDLQQRIPDISQRMLTLTLRHLERDGLISRTAHAEVPPRVEYELTDVGRTLIGPAVHLAEWAASYSPDIDRSQQLYDAQQPPDHS